MRVLILANADIGLYKFRKELIECLCERHDVFIALPNGEYVPELVKIGCEFFELEFNRRGTNPLADIKQILRYRKLIKKINPDIVLTYTIKPNVYGGIACQLSNKEYIANVTGLGTSIENGGLLSIISKLLYRTGLQKAKCVFFQNEENRKMFVTQKIVRGKTRLIPGSGVNLQTHCLEEYPEEEDCFRFLFVGRIMKDKGIEELLSAMRVIHKENPKVILDLVGFCDEDYLSELQTAQDRGELVFHGMQKDVHPYYKNCHCTVLPSYHEGTANVILEASATGRPIITTRVPGCKETFDEGLTGLGCEARSAKSLEEAMRKMIGIGTPERKQMGLRARAKMEREYNREIVIKAYEEEIVSQ